jgi:hypothetical protein
MKPDASFFLINFQRAKMLQKILPEVTWAVERGTTTPTAAVKKLLNSLNN